MSVNDNYDFNFILESVTLTGKRIRLEPLIPSVHAEELYEVSHVNPESRKVFDYLPYGPFNTYQEFLNFLNGPRIKGDNHTILFCIIDIVSEKKIGIAGVTWKCHSNNINSRKSAERLGYKFEGTLRNHYLIKKIINDTEIIDKRNSDFLSIIDSEWEDVKKNLLEKLK
ncbi:hypothetical protein RhiirA4_409973 [Rhizophagus irregularis]|uniref:N-acetyltransferase domain-containing protein n=1 Tax=Rhizophagus irregularis TaxID=588596 RepID=A0A2I1H748_9GLOM|nr:hypothetical protein RhiirA4_409973 [Rhizophagus irregularis]